MTKNPEPIENQPKADERNIVSVDSSYEGASFEDRMFLFWKQYRKLIVGASAVALLALAGWGLIVFVQERHEMRMTNDFQEAITIDQKKAFAEKASPHALAGLAHLEVADYHFANNEFEEAARYFRLAAPDLGDLSAAGRAMIGQGISLALAGKEGDALTHFEGVARDTRNFATVRAEAYYHAATLAIETNQTETARDYIDRIDEIDSSQVWASRAQGLKQALPKAPATAEAPPAEPSEAS